MSERSRPYHHGDLRAALVAEALAIARHDRAALSLREVTRRAGVTPAAAYRHFRDRSALLAALAREIQDRMVVSMRARVAGPGSSGPGSTDPARAALRHLRGVGLGYIDFAREEPGWFELAFFGGEAEREQESGPAGPAVPDAVPTGDGAGPPEPTALAQVPPFAELLAALDECTATGALAADRRPGAEFSCWSAVHGCAELIVHGPLRGAPPQVVQAVAERVVDDIISGIR